MNGVRNASLTSQGVQHRVLYRDGHPSRYQPRPTGNALYDTFNTLYSLHHISPTISFERAPKVFSRKENRLPSWQENILQKLQKVIRKMRGI